MKNSKTIKPAKRAVNKVEDKSAGAFLSELRGNMERQLERAGLTMDAKVPFAICLVAIDFENDGVEGGPNTGLAVSGRTSGDTSTELALLTTTLAKDERLQSLFRHALAVLDEFGPEYLAQMTGVRSDSDVQN